jgi:hypothetical protein
MPNLSDLTKKGSVNSLSAYIVGYDASDTSQASTGTTITWPASAFQTLVWSQSANYGVNNISTVYTTVNSNSASWVSIMTPRVVYVEPLAGDDGTAEVGNPAKPYETAQAAYNAWKALNQDGAMVCGVGNCGGLVLTQSMSYTLHISGQGRESSELGGINAAGVDGTSGTGGTPGGPGANGYALKITSDGTINVGNIDVSGGIGGLDDGAGGGDGGDAGPVELRGLVGGSVNLNGGDPSDVARDNGLCSRAVVNRCVFTSYSAINGTGGSGGESGVNQKIVNCIFDMIVISGLSSDSLLATSVYNGSSTIGSVTPQSCATHDEPDVLPI